MSLLPQRMVTSQDYLRCSFAEGVMSCQKICRCSFVDVRLELSIIRALAMEMSWIGLRRGKGSSRNAEYLTQVGHE